MKLAVSLSVTLPGLGTAARKPTLAAARALAVALVAAVALSGCDGLSGNTGPGDPQAPAADVDARAAGRDGDADPQAPGSGAAGGGDAQSQPSANLPGIDPSAGAEPDSANPPGGHRAGGGATADARAATAAPDGGTRTNRNATPTGGGAEGAGDSRPSGPRLVRVTEPGCCTDISWAPDSRALLYVDRPPGAESAAIYQVPADASAPPAVRFDTVALYSDDLQYRVDVDGERVTLVRLADGRRTELPTGGRPPALSPGGTRIVWQVSNRDVPWERRVTQVWVAEASGANPRQIASLNRGGPIGWIGEDALLVEYRPTGSEGTDVIARLGLDGSLESIASAERIRGTELSPTGGRLAYLVSGAREADSNGIWILDLERNGGPERLPQEHFGPFEWQDDNTLIIVPMEVGAPSHRLVGYDVDGRRFRDLTDPSVLPFTIANGDWHVSPDGRRVAFVSAADYAIWVITLPSPVGDG